MDYSFAKSKVKLFKIYCNTCNCRCDAAGVTVEQVEDFFCRNFRKKNKKDSRGWDRPNQFYSKVMKYTLLINELGHVLH